MIGNLQLTLGVYPDMSRRRAVGLVIANVLVTALIMVRYEVRMWPDIVRSEAREEARRRFPPVAPKGDMPGWDEISIQYKPPLEIKATMAVNLPAFLLIGWPQGEIGPWTPAVLTRITGPAFENQRFRIRLLYFDVLFLVAVITQWTALVYFAHRQRWRMFAKLPLLIITFSGMACLIVNLTPIADYPGILFVLFAECAWLALAMCTIMVLYGTVLKSIFGRRDANQTANSRRSTAPQS